MEVSILSAQNVTTLGKQCMLRVTDSKQKPACFEDESLNIFDHIWKHVAQVDQTLFTF